MYSSNYMIELHLIYRKQGKIRWAKLLVFNSTTEVSPWIYIYIMQVSYNGIV